MLDPRADAAVRDASVRQQIEGWEKLGMAGHGTDSRVRLQATFLPAARMLLLVTTFSWFLGAGMLVAAPLGAQAITGTLVEAETDKVRISVLFE